MRGGGGGVNERTPTGGGVQVVVDAVQVVIERRDDTLVKVIVFVCSRRSVDVSAGCRGVLHAQSAQQVPHARPHSLHPRRKLWKVVAKEVLCLWFCVMLLLLIRAVGAYFAAVCGCVSSCVVCVGVCVCVSFGS